MRVARQRGVPSGSGQPPPPPPYTHTLSMRSTCHCSLMAASFSDVRRPPPALPTLLGAEAQPCAGQWAPWYQEGLPLLGQTCNTAAPTASCPLPPKGHHQPWQRRVQHRTLLPLRPHLRQDAGGQQGGGFEACRRPGACGRAARARGAAAGAVVPGQRAGAAGGLHAGVRGGGAVVGDQRAGACRAAGGLGCRAHSGPALLGGACCGCGSCRSQAAAHLAEFMPPAAWRPGCGPSPADPLCVWSKSSRWPLPRARPCT